jgi:hypothetical protein
MFIYKDNGNANGGRILLPVTITNASVISVGEAVKLASGKLVTWGAGGAGLGIVASIQKADGSPVTTNGAGGAFTGTYTAGAAEDVVALVDVSTTSRYSVPYDAALGSTNGSGSMGTNADCDSTSLVLAETSTLAVGNTASFFVWGVDPDGEAPANSVIVSIQESVVKI